MTLVLQNVKAKGGGIGPWRFLGIVRCDREALGGEFVVWSDCVLAYVRTGVYVLCPACVRAGSGGGSGL